MHDIIKPLKMKKVNIGLEDELKFATIGDYWDEDTIKKITDLVHEYQELFPIKFSDMEGIVGESRVMNIHLNHYLNPVKWRPYTLNPKYKEKVKEKLDKMIAAGIIEPIE